MLVLFVEKYYIFIQYLTFHIVNFIWVNNLKLLMIHYKTLVENVGKYLTDRWERTCSAKPKKKWKKLQMKISIDLVI